MMPRVEMRDPFGTMFRIDTGIPGMLQAWFEEWLPKLYPAGMERDFGDPLIMSVYPLDPDGTGYDWPADTRYISQPFNIPRDPARALDALAARRAWIDEQIKANQR
jgi:hypothetical protein